MHSSSTQVGERKCIDEDVCHHPGGMGEVKTLTRKFLPGTFIVDDNGSLEGAGHSPKRLMAVNQAESARIFHAALVGGQLILSRCCLAPQPLPLSVRDACVEIKSRRGSIAC